MKKPFIKLCAAALCCLVATAYAAGNGAPTPTPTPTVDIESCFSLGKDDCAKKFVQFIEEAQTKDEPHLYLVTHTFTPKPSDFSQDYTSPIMKAFTDAAQKNVNVSFLVQEGLSEVEGDDEETKQKNRDARARLWELAYGGVRDLAHWNSGVSDSTNDNLAENFLLLTTKDGDQDAIVLLSGPIGHRFETGSKSSPFTLNILSGGGTADLIKGYKKSFDALKGKTSIQSLISPNGDSLVSPFSSH